MMYSCPYFVLHEGITIMLGMDWGLFMNPTQEKKVLLLYMLLDLPHYLFSRIQYA